MFYLYFSSNGNVESLSTERQPNKINSEFINIPDNTNKASFLRDIGYEHLSVVDRVLLVDGANFFSFNEIKTFLLQRIKDLDFVGFNKKNSVFLEYLNVLIEQEREGVLTFPVQTRHISTGAPFSITNTTQLHNLSKQALESSRQEYEEYVNRWADAKVAIESATTVKELMNIVL